MGWPTRSWFRTDGHTIGGVDKAGMVEKYGSDARCVNAAIPRLPNCQLARSVGASKYTNALTAGNWVGSDCSMPFRKSCCSVFGGTGGCPVWPT